MDRGWTWCRTPGWWLENLGRKNSFWVSVWNSSLDNTIVGKKEGKNTVKWVGERVGRGYPVAVRRRSLDN
jgi:hypothetical protein